MERQKIVDVYAIGFADGLKAFAHWKDGEQFVGTCGTTLNDALRNIYTNGYFAPAGAIDRVGISEDIDETS
jgi:hypothetical protein